MSNSPRPSIRPLYAWEIQEARRVFGSRIAYHKVRIHENAAWTDSLNILGAKLKRIQPSSAHNAVTLGNHIYFPVRLLQNAAELNGPKLYLFTWLVHELTHVWQFQESGWRYMVLALNAQFAHGAHAYDYGGEHGLEDFFQKGGRWIDFNLEQQGDIARAYYDRLVQGKSVKAWQPFADHFQHKA